MKFKLVVLALISLPFISGCITATPPPNAYVHSDTSNGRKAIAVELVNVSLSLSVNANKLGVNTNRLSDAQLAQVRHFVLQQGSSYKQRILVNGSADNLVLFLPQLSQLLTELGIGQDKQRFSPANSITNNKLVLISEYFQAIAPSCLSDSRADIGCANSRNLAMMIADPAQLLRAAPRAPTDANKAVSAIKAYRLGTPMDSRSLSDMIKGGN